jgi:hypothetical protein
MSSDLLALVVAATLGTAVVVLGLRRDLSETTLSGLPRFGEGAERATVTLGLYVGEERHRRPLSPRKRRWLAAFYLVLALAHAAFAVLWADNWLLEAGMAGMFAIGGVLILRQGSSSSPSAEPAS